MTFTEASAFVMPFGQHKGQTLDQIATTDRGLSYLDWLRGERKSDAQVYMRDHLDGALVVYLSDPTIAADVAKVARG